MATPPLSKVANRDVLMSPQVPTLISYAQFLQVLATP